MNGRFYFFLAFISSLVFQAASPMLVAEESLETNPRLTFGHKKPFLDSAALSESVFDFEAAKLSEIFKEENPLDDTKLEQPKLPKLCLHMIVKNETHVIKRCLDSVKPLINYWVIVDTGSTDGTQEMVRECLQDIPGELYEIPWVNWGETRSQAIAYALNKGEYILLMDADDILEFAGEVKLPPLTEDQYNMWRGCKSFIYQRPQIIKGDLPWKYTGMTHEYLDCPIPYTAETLQNVRYITFGDGALSHDLKKKFLNNVALLEAGLKKEPNNYRYAFYLAESYLDAGEKGKALEMYQKRIDMGGWDQEIFWSKLQMSHIMRDLKFPTNVILEAYKDAHAFRPHRSEPVYFMTEILNQLGQYDEAYRILKSHEFFQKPTEKDALFNVVWIDDFGLLFQLTICSYYTNHFEESLDACDKLLANANLPEDWRHLTESNRTFPVQKLKEKLLAR